MVACACHKIKIAVNMYAVQMCVSASSLRCNCIAVPAGNWSIALDSNCFCFFRNLLSNPARLIIVNDNDNDNYSNCADHHTGITRW